MKDLEHGAYRQESYVAHISKSTYHVYIPPEHCMLKLCCLNQDIPQSDNVVLLTSTRVLSFWTIKLRLEWDLPFTQVQGVTVEDRGIRFAHRSGRTHDKFVPITDKSSQSWFFGQVASVVKQFNVRRRLESGQ